MAANNDNNYDEEFWGPRQSAPAGKRRAKRRPAVDGGDPPPGGGSRWLLWLLLVVLFAGFAYLGFGISQQWLGTGPAGTGEDEEGIARAAADKRLNVLLVGTDQRAEEASRADTIIVASLDPKTSTVNLLSIPRDTYVTVPGRGKTKINHAHAYGGAALLQKTVEEFLGIAIDSYVEVNFEGFQNIIDVLGGLELDVEKRMSYPPEGIDLQPGRQRLNGYNALAYVRFRGDAMGDISRIGRQQKFLSALADQAMSVGTVLKLPKLVSAVTANVRTDLGPGEMLALAKAFRKVNTAGMQTAMVPGSPATIGGVSYWEADAAKKDELVAKLFRTDASDRGSF